MLSVEDNEMLTRTGPGTLMGNLLRRYWIPALLSSELPKPDGPPVRLTLLGERLVAFRDSEGKVGLVEEACPHRLASLYFGRNEEGGLRCVYHGWKFDRHGRCVDMPSEPPESNFKDKIHLTAYPCEERGGVVWTYMGPPDKKPPLPELEWALVPPEHRYITRRIEECNYFQAIEGGIDSSHVSFLHRGDLHGLNVPSSSLSNDFLLRDTAPRFEVEPVEHGLLIAARRQAGPGQVYWRITQFLMPWYTMVPPFADAPRGGHAWVPMDDEHCWTWSIDWHPLRPLSEDELNTLKGGYGIHMDLIPGTLRPVQNRDNDYLIDRERQASGLSFSGIKGVAAEDQALQESQGPIVDRSREHLGTSDAGIIAARRLMLKTARQLAEGDENLPGLRPESQRVRAASLVLPEGVPFVEGAREALVSRPDVFVAAP